MDSINSLFSRDVHLEVGEVGYRHPVVLRLTPWSVTLVSNPCADFPASLRLFSGCDCQSRLENLMLRVDDQLQRWALGDSPKRLALSSKKLSIPVEIGAVIDQFQLLADSAPHDDDGPRREVLASIVSAGAESAGSARRPSNAGRQRKRGRHRPVARPPLELDREFPVIAFPTYERFVEQLLESKDPEHLWYGLKMLRSASSDRIESLLQPRFRRALTWPIGLRLMVIHLSGQLSGLREEDARGDLVAATLAEPSLAATTRRRLLAEIPVSRPDAACRMLLDSTTMSGVCRGREIGAALDRILTPYVDDLPSWRVRCAVTRSVVDLLVVTHGLESCIQHHAAAMVDDLVAYLQCHPTRRELWGVALRLLSCTRSLDGGFAILKLLERFIGNPMKVGGCLIALNHLVWSVTKRSERAAEFLFAVLDEIDRVKAQLAEGFHSKSSWGADVRRDLARLESKLQAAVDKVAGSWDANATFAELLQRLDSKLGDSQREMVLAWGESILRKFGPSIDPQLIQKVMRSSTWRWRIILSKNGTMKLPDAP